MTGLWTRVAWLGAVVLVLLLAASLPRPPAPPGPDFTEVLEPAVEAFAQPSLWYCPWVNSGASRDTRIAVAFEPDIGISFTHPDPRVGEPADIGELLADGPGAIIQSVAEIVNRGDAPGFVEFSNGPATAAVVVEGDTSLSGDRCVGSVPKLWHIAGLTTRDGYDLMLRLYNPIPDNAKVQVRASSELGSEALPDLQTIDVVGRTWVDVDLREAIPFLDNLVVTVGTEEGIVIPTIVQGRPGEEANWSGTGLSTEWYFATSSLAGLSPRLSVWNPNGGPVDVEVDIFTRTSAVGAAFAATIEAGRPIEFPLSDQAPGAVGVRVRATDGVAAVIVAEDIPPETPAGDEQPADEEQPTRIAGTTGSPQPSLSWLLPGAGGFIGGESSIWLLNPNGDPVTVTLQPLGSGVLAADKVRIEPNTIRRIRLATNGNVAGYRVDAAIPIVASWSLQSADAVALLAGVPIGE